MIRKLESEGKQIADKQEDIVEKPKHPEQGDVLSELKQQQNSFKSMTNILNAYENAYDDKKPL